MKRTSFPIILLLLLGSTLQAQESEKYLSLQKRYAYQEGYIITLDDEKVEGLVYQNPINAMKEYYLVVFIHKDGTKVKYRPRHVKKYGYSMYNFVSDNGSFYKEVEIGPAVCLYEKMENQSYTTGGHYGSASQSFSSSKSYLYLRKTGESTFKRVRKFNFKDEYSMYFRDCPMVKEEIQNRNFTYKNLSRIVREYNYCR